MNFHLKCSAKISFRQFFFPICSNVLSFPDMSESDIQEILPAPNDAPRSLSSSLKEVIEYKLPKENLSNEVHSYFYVQFRNGRKTDIRKCIKCGEKVKSINSGTTTLHRHHNTCSKDARKNAPIIKMKG